MKRRINLGNASNLIVSNFAIVLYLGLGITCAFYKLSLVAGLFFFLCLLGVISRIWGGIAMRGLSAEASCARTRLFPGETTEIEYTVRNDKSLPLIWLEVSQLAPPHDCLVPDDNFEYFYKEYNTKHGVDYETHVRQKFSFVLGHRTVTFPSTWLAKRRGFYQMENVILRSGDGFGMTQQEQTNETMNIPDFAVYPRPIPVNISSLLMEQWDCQIGTKGYVEDPTIIRGIRDYQVGDSWKRINWRNVARQQELKVNVYEIIKPKALHFIIDGESFARITPDNKHLESMLEIIGSVLIALFDMGVACGLSLPKSENFPAINLAPDGSRSLEGLLYYLAGYNFANELHPDSKPDHKIWLPSQFDHDGAASAAMIAGRTYYICFRTPREIPDMLKNIEPSRAVILSVMDADINPPYDIPVHSLSSLRRGTAEEEERKDD